LFYINEPFKSVYNRLISANPKRTAKLYYFDQVSSTMEIVNLLQHQPELFGTYKQFLSDCKKGQLPDYSFVEPNYTDHDGDDGALIASDQHPDHHVQAGELFIASVYNAIKSNDELWKSTALLVTYDEHGGIYDHVPPPPCTPDGFVATPNDTGTGREFKFDRLGVRVPTILVSPWIKKGTVVSDRVFEHASIPATVTEFFVGDYDQRSPREKATERFIERTDKPVDANRNLLALDVMRDDCPDFDLG
jgi:phospholipase C